MSSIVVSSLKRYKTIAQACSSKK